MYIPPVFLRTLGNCLWYADGALEIRRDELYEIVYSLHKTIRNNVLIVYSLFIFEDFKNKTSSSNFYASKMAFPQLSLFNSLTTCTQNQLAKFSSANFQKMLSPSYIILRIQRLDGKQCRSR